MTKELTFPDVNVFIDALDCVYSSLSAEQSSDMREAFSDPQAVLDPLWQARDPRMNDLAEALEDGCLATTQAVLRQIVYTAVDKKGFTRHQAVAMAGALTRGGFIHPDRMEWDSTLRPLALGPMVDRVRAAFAPDGTPASVLLADMHPSGAARNPADERVDGEDLGIMVQIEAVAEYTQSPVRFISSDKAAATLVEIMNIARVEFYARHAGRVVVRSGRAHQSSPSRSARTP